MKTERRIARRYLSYPIEEGTPIYGNGNGFRRKDTNRIRKGNSCNTELWQMPNHIGTHVDVPRHFDDMGQCVNDFSAEYWVFEKAHMVSICAEPGELISLLEERHNIPRDAELLLIKTGFDRFRGTDIYWEDNPGLSFELADWLRQNRSFVRAVGCDFISVSRWRDREGGRKAHRCFLGEGRGNPIVLVEDMNLSTISEGMTIRRIYMLPICVRGADGAPCTIIAEIED